MKKQILLLSIICVLGFSNSLFSQPHRESYTLKDPILNQGSSIKQYDYVARDYIRLTNGFRVNGNNGIRFSAKTNPLLLFPPTDATYMTSSGTITNDPTKGNVVGSVPAQFNVSPTGAATYTIPIECPSGINGMQPNISLTYNSQSQNGIAGWGWNIGGLSMISRVPKNYLHDYEKSGLIWDKNSPLALNGNRLFVHKEYTDSIEYWPEKDIAARIVGYNIKSFGPETIVVYTKDGKKMFYGSKSSDASYMPLIGIATYVPGTNHVMSRRFSKRKGWSLVKVEDSNGNYMELNYGMDINGINVTSHRITSINYGANKKASTSHFAKIDFIYERRTDKEEKFLNGSVIKQAYRLDEVVVNCYNKEFYRYNLNYRFDEVSKLVSVEQSSNGVSLPPIRFKWAEHDYTVNKKQNKYSFPESPNYKAQKDKGHGCILKFHGGDFDGDGISDFIVEENFSKKGYITDPSALNWALYLNKGNRYCSFKAEGYYDKRYWANGLFVFDKDGDGKSELYVKKLLKECHTSYVGGGENPDEPKKDRPIEIPETGSGSGTAITTCVYYSQLQCFELINDKFIRNDKKDIKIRLENSGHHDKLNILPGDYDGDGELDLVTFYSDGTFYRTTGIYAPKSLNNLGKSKDYQLLDFNGDGKTDLLLEKKGNIEIYSFNEKERKFERIYETSSYRSADDIKVGDFNGDGNSDLLIKKYKSKWEIKQSTGTSLVDGINVPTLQYNSFTPYQIDCSDINQDGKCDILYFKDASPDYNSSAWSPDYQLNILVSNGTYFTKKAVLNNLTVEGKEVDRLTTLGNYNRDGANDIVLHNHSAKIPSLFGFKDKYVFNKVESVTNSLGQKININYGYSGINGIDGIRRSDYNGGYQIAAEKCIGLSVVESVTGHETNLSYGYGQSIVDKKGRGFLGYDLFAITDRIKNQISVSEFEFEPYRKLLSLKKQYTKLANGTSLKGANLKSSGIGGGSLINEVVYNNIIKKIYPRPSKCYRQYVEKSTTKDYLTKTSTTKSFTIDNWGNETKVIEKLYGDHSESNLVMTITTDVPEYAQKGAWCKNKPVKKIVTSEYHNDTYTRTTQYEYDSKGNLTKVTHDPGDANQLMTQYKNINSFGFAERIETTANGKTKAKIIKYSPSGRFVKEKINEFTKFKTIYNYNKITGLLDDKTDHKGLKTSYKYDNFGRLTHTTFPDGVYATTSLQWAKGNGPANAKYYKYTETSGSSPLWIWYDSKGRKIREESYGLARKKIWVDTEYDAKGRIYSVSQPYFANGTKKADVTYTYDSYNRVKTQLTPAGTITTTYNGLETTVTTPNGTSKLMKNAAGFTTSSIVNGRSVLFTHWASGQTKTSTPQGGKAVETHFDLQGNRKKLIDPDAGTIESSYNGFGELVWEKHKKTNEKGKVITILTKYQYDLAGRTSSVTCNDVTTNYSYNSTTGFLTSVIKPEHEVYYRYDENGKKNLGRVTTTTEKIGSDKSFSFKYEYDAFGRESKYTYPSGYSVSNIYDKYGYLTEVKDKINRSIWKVEEANAKGQLTETKKGNSYVSFGYDTKGRPETIFCDGIIDHQYLFNAKGNLQHRISRIGNDTQKEIFSYNPNNNQLEGWEIMKNSVKTATFDMNYDDHGNITGKTDIGYSMNYKDPNRIHALTSISGNPTLIADDEQNITYTDFLKVETIAEGNNFLKISYGNDNQRRKAVLKNKGSVSKTRYYLGDYEEDINADVDDRKVHYISGGNGLAAIYIETAGTGKLYYAYTDYLGSLTTLTDESGIVVERHAFDAWGNRRDVNNWQNKLSAPVSSITDRGFTMHEHLDAFALINMNGRVYDPTLARFLSPDPQLQNPNYWLNYNRYAYGYNNPLMYTDPSGEVVHILIGAAVGGLINLGVKAFQGKINSFGDGFAAFGIGAVAGAVGAATGGAAFVAVGGAAGGAGGFFAGAISGAVGSAFSSPLQSIGNSLYFGDPFMTGKQYLTGIATGALMGGIVNGGIGAFKGRTFWKGTLKSPSAQTPVATPCPKFDAPEIETPKLKLPNEGRQELMRMADDVLPEQQPLIRVSTPDGPVRYVTPDAAKGVTNTQLVKRAAKFADDFVPFTKNAGVTGTLKHQVANRYLHLYQLRNGSRGLETNFYFNNGVGKRGFLDVVNHSTKTVWDFKFGNATWGPGQLSKYQSNFPGYNISIMRP